MLFYIFVFLNTENCDPKAEVTVNLPLKYDPFFH